MRKIMFNDRYGLTQAVIDGTKTMTRRPIKDLCSSLVIHVSELHNIEVGRDGFTVTYSTGERQNIFPAYQVGEEVAVAQRYWDLCNNDGFYEALQKADPSFPLECIKGEKGCHNKMFVRAGWMPNRIRIANIRVERLQNIDDEDAMREGIVRFNSPIGLVYIFYGSETDVLDRASFGRGWIKLDGVFPTPRKAFAALINKLNGKGTWERNPWEFVYEFELAK